MMTVQNCVDDVMLTVQLSLLVDDVMLTMHADCAGVVPGGVALPNHWMREVHLVTVALECQENSEALGRLQVRM